MKFQNSPLREKTMNFALRMVELNQYLTSKKEFIISKQIFRSGINPGAMIREAVNAESSSDFIHKMAIAQKEIAETQFWLELLWKSGYLNEIQFKSLFSDSDEIMCNKRDLT